MITYYCVHCWAEVTAEQAHCPVCGAALEDVEYDLVLRYCAALRHPEPTRACLACEMLAELGDRRAVPPLLDLLARRPRAYEVLCAAAESLGALGDPAAIPALLALLQDREAAIPARLAALRALARSDRFGTAACTTALTWAAASDRPSLREEAARLMPTCTQRA